MPVTITSKKHGFRRAGIAHAAEPQTYPDGFFTPAQTVDLKAEAMLTVVISPANPVDHLTIARAAEGVTGEEIPLPGAANDPAPTAAAPGPVSAKTKKKSK